jgi:hypothetical protein
MSCCGKQRRAVQVQVFAPAPELTPLDSAVVTLRNKSRYTLSLAVPGGGTYDFVPGQDSDIPREDAEVLLRTGLFAVVATSETLPHAPSLTLDS